MENDQGVKAIEKFGIYNGTYQLLSEEDIVKIFGDDYAYEVIRLINGKPFFLEGHFNRLLNTCVKSGVEITVDIGMLNEEIAILIKKQKLQNTNVKIIVKQGKRAIFAIQSFYPSAKEYKKGIGCELLFEARENPELKIFQAELRKKADKIKQQKNIYELLLVGQDGDITEGSKSNFFLIKDDTLYTAPSTEVLSGITRQMIIEIARENNIRLIYKSVNYKRLDDYNAVFICGTSPGVIAIRRIGELNFRVDNPILIRIQRAYVDLEDKATR
ncbi:MAG: aminotransferase class IV [Bacteroidales bacterium]|nr:aminotransferase class IV [Bacteroidales bacterium]